jgi:ABC-type tungstate transport system substrate-binding protein
VPFVSGTPTFENSADDVAGSGSLWTRIGFIDMFVEFDLKVSLQTTIALWIGLPILAIGITVLLFLVGRRPPLPLVTVLFAV